jgi:phosphate/sulfate permease
MGLGFGKTLADMRFIGWVGLIWGILTCLSIVGAIVGVPLIIACHRFIEGVNRFENYRRQRTETELKEGFAELGRSFRVLKILTIIYIVFIVGYIAFLFLLGGLGIMSELAGS